MKLAILTFIGLAATLGVGSALPKAATNTGSPLDRLIRDPSGRGHSRLFDDGTVQSVDANGITIDKIQLTDEDAAKIRAMSRSTSESRSTTTNLFARSCPFQVCNLDTGDGGCSKIGCNGGCNLTCYTDPISGVTSCVTAICLA
ncbi:hypothetical protein V495_03063 [Pseudogymnoascus sp. VKM F-4514 (FW-929)]|nr:hypothetical protein V495_03063 [Pseudogymnoascus sp. VKM F-4514 (FW-929)]KFY60065.1 hypothetical protein V497_03895 [Pseudogymnoascus sp. VKM F-4516 (FW-969)]